MSIIDIHAHIWLGREEDNIKCLRRAALANPETAFIMAHLGGNCYHGIPMIWDLQNVFVDVSALPAAGTIFHTL